MSLDKIANLRRVPRGAGPEGGRFAAPGTVHEGQVHVLPKLEFGERYTVTHSLAVKPQVMTYLGTRDGRHNFLPAGATEARALRESEVFGVGPA